MAPLRSILIFAGAAALLLLNLSCAATPATESDWNRMGLWRRVGDQPATYVPAGYAATRPRTEREGSWYTDGKDGKRLFVPREKVGEWSPAVLTSEAIKVTGDTSHKPEKGFRTRMEDGTAGFCHTFLKVLAGYSAAEDHELKGN